MASIDYSFIETFAAKFKDPDGWDAVGTPTGSADQFFAELGKLAKKIQDGKLTTADVESAKALLGKFSDGINRLNARVASAALGNAEDAKFAKAFRSMAADVNLKLQQFSYAADEIIAGRSSSLASLSEGASGILKNVGGLLGLAQIANEFYKNGFTAAGVDAAGEKALGVLTGMVAAEVAAAVAGGVAVALGAPFLVVAAAAIVVGAGVGYAAGKTGESLWEPGRWWFENEFLPTVFDASTQAYNTVSVGLSDLAVKMGKFDGTWLAGLNATPEQKAAMTTLLAGVSQLPASSQMNADIKKLLDAPFVGGALVSRDALIRTVLLISQEQHAYVSERISVDAGTVTINMPPNAPGASIALRDLAGKLLSPVDQAGFAITGPSKVLVATAGGAISGTSSDDLILGSLESDTIVGGSGNDEILGGAGADELQGQAGTDALFGGDGADTLDGGTGPDYLYGGAGSDTYDFTGAFGGDWVVDSDGAGAIQVDGLKLTGGKKVTPGVYQDDASDWIYVVAGDNLILRKDGSVNSITIRGWAPGQLGITLDEASAAATPATNTYTGDFAKKVNDTSYAFGNGGYEAAGAQANAQDLITGSDAADEIKGLGGNDGLAGGGGDDLIEGGDGDDLLLGGAGEDTLNGGAGADFIYGSGTGRLVYPRTTQDPPPVATGTEYARGFSWVVYEGGTDVNGIKTYSVKGADLRAVAGDDTKVIDGGAGNDKIVAGSGSDIVHGGADNDDIRGMKGNDFLYGDDGDDTISGDGLEGGGPTDRLLGNSGCVGVFSNPTAPSANWAHLLAANDAKRRQA